MPTFQNNKAGYVATFSSHGGGGKSTFWCILFKNSNYATNSWQNYIKPGQIRLMETMKWSLPVSAPSSQHTALIPPYLDYCTIVCTSGNQAMPKPKFLLK